MDNICEKTCLKGCCKYHVIEYEEKPEIENHSNHHSFLVRKSGVFIYDPANCTVLLVQSRGRLWGPPKGSIEENETSVKCAIREVLEETGIVISEDTINYAKWICIRSKAVYFYTELPQCEVSVQNDNPDNDANGIGWFSIPCLVELVNSGIIKINFHCKVVIKEFLQIDIK